MGCHFPYQTYNILDIHVNGGIIIVTKGANLCSLGALRAPLTCTNEMIMLNNHTQVKVSATYGYYPVRNKISWSTCMAHIRKFLLFINLHHEDL